MRVNRSAEGSERGFMAISLRDKLVTDRAVVHSAVYKPTSFKTLRRSESKSSISRIESMASG